MVEWVEKIQSQLSKKVEELTPEDLLISQSQVGDRDLTPISHEIAAVSG